MESKGEYVSGKYCGIAITVSEDGQARRTQITKELDQLEDLIAADSFSMIAPMLFCGKRATNENARYLTALEFDLDFLRLDKSNELVGIKDFLYQTSLLEESDPFNRLPTPTYVIASSPRNLHVVYLLDEPIAMYLAVLKSVRAFRREFIPKLWDSWITEASKKPQFETSPVQAFRLVGSRTKHKDTVVRCFQTGARVSVDYLNQYTTKAKIDLSGSRLSLDKAKELYPDWYQRRIVEQRPKYTWQAPEGLYQWWLNRLPEVEVGHRYHYLVCLAAYAQKCHIEQDKFLKDIALCRKELDKISPPDNPLTMADMSKAAQCNSEPYRLLTRSRISELSGLDIQPQKRNGRTREQHLTLLNGTNALRREMGEEFAPGAPTKKELVQDFIKAHPEMNNSEVAAALKVSRPTVIKWRKELFP